MPRTIDEGFRDFHTQLTPSDVETENAARHRGSIDACLRSHYTVKRLFRTGSFGNGTSIYGYSDVDYFVCVPTNELKDSSNTSLRQLRMVLEERFPSTGVSVDCPAVRVPFGTTRNEAHDITVADHVGLLNGRDVYEIPDCENGWMRSSPDTHNAYVHAINQKLGWKIKPLIRFIKAWKCFRDVPLSSFYLELRVAQYAASEATVAYSIDVRSFLKRLQDSGIAQMQDPAGVGGYIQPCRSAVLLEDARSKLDTAVTRANHARQAEQDGNVKEAFEWWDKLYNFNFPNYYR